MRAEVESCVTCRFSEFQLWRLDDPLIEIDCYRFPKRITVDGDGCGEYKSTETLNAKINEYEQLEIERARLRGFEEEPPCTPKTT